MSRDLDSIFDIPMDVHRSPVIRLEINDCESDCSMDDVEVKDGLFSAANDAGSVILPGSSIGAPSFIEHRCFSNANTDSIVPFDTVGNHNDNINHNNVNYNNVANDNVDDSTHMGDVNNASVSESVFDHGVSDGSIVDLNDEFFGNDFVADNDDASAADTDSDNVDDIRGDPNAVELFRAAVAGPDTRDFVLDSDINDIVAFYSLLESAIDNIASDPATPKSIGSQATFANLKGVLGDRSDRRGPLCAAMVVLRAREHGQNTDKLLRFVPKEDEDRVKFELYKNATTEDKTLLRTCKTLWKKLSPR